MFNSKLLILLALLLLMAFPAGLVYAQGADDAVPTLISADEPPYDGEGTAVIWDSDDGDDATISDVITYAMTGVTAPGDGMVYEGWLVTDDRGTKLSTGLMMPDTGGAISHTWASPDGENLLASYDLVVITVEPVDDPDPGPSDIVAFSHSIPAEGIVHIRHLLVSWPPGEANGILTNLKMQIDLAITHANLAWNSDTLAAVKQHIEHTINIIEGESGPNFGDLNNDDSVQNPGDGIGVFGHAADGRKHAQFTADAVPDDEVINDHADLVIIHAQNAEDNAATARDMALNSVLTANSVEIAKLFLNPNLFSVQSLLVAAAHGFDADGNGTIEAVNDNGMWEGGADQAYVEAQLMATYTLEPGPPAAPPAIPESITVSLASATVMVGDTQQLTATLNISDGTSHDITASVTWSTSDEAVATVDSSGLVTTVGAGTATITATGEGFTSTADVTVEAPADSTGGLFGPILGLPSVGDPSVSIIAQVALIAALILLTAGGVLVIRGRRSRLNA